MTRTLKTGIAISLALHALAGAGVAFWWQAAALPGSHERDVPITFVSVAQEVYASPASAEVPTTQTAVPIEAAPQPEPQKEIVPVASQVAVEVAVVKPVAEKAVVTPPQPAAPAPIQPVLPTTPAPVPSSNAVTSTEAPQRQVIDKPLSVRAAPVYRNNPEPQYPASARRRRQEGLVLLTVTVSSEGRPVRVRLKRGSGTSALDEAAIAAVREWEFEPARAGLIPMESEVEVPVRFQLSK